MTRPLRLYELKPFSFADVDCWSGTYKTFGFKSWLCLASPLANTILNWKYRDMELDFGGAEFPFKGHQPKVIEGGKGE